MIPSRAGWDKATLDDLIRLVAGCMLEDPLCSIMRRETRVPVEPLAVMARGDGLVGVLCEWMLPSAPCRLKGEEPVANSSTEDDALLA